MATCHRGLFLSLKALRGPPSLVYTNHIPTNSLGQFLFPLPYQQLCLFEVLGIELVFLHMIGKGSTSELLAQPLFSIIAILAKKKWYLIVVSICISLLAKMLGIFHVCVG